MVNKKLVNTRNSAIKSSTKEPKKKPKEIMTSTRRSKRKHRNESDGEKDGDTDNDPPKISYDVQKKNNKGKKIKKDVAAPRLKVIEARQSPKWLNDVIAATNPNQKQVIRDMGFGSLLDGAYDFDFVPVALGGFVVDIFDHNTCKFNLPNGRSIKVTKELIHDTIGLPMGGKEIKPKDRSSGNHPHVQQFRKQYCEKEIKAYFIKPLEGIMGLMKESDRLFKLNFLVMATSVLIECTKAGCVNQAIIECIPDRDEDIKGLDWCGYVLESMIACRKGYNFKSHFNGPLLVMVLIYVNSTLLINDEPTRLKPYLSSWNSEKLKERQNREIKEGGFGLDHVRIVNGLEDVVQQKTASKKRKSVSEKEAEAEDFVIGDADLKNEKRRIIENLKNIEDLKKLVDNSLSGLIANHPSDKEVHKIQSVRLDLYRSFRYVGDVFVETINEVDGENILVDAGHVGSSTNVADAHNGSNFLEDVNNKNANEHDLGPIPEVDETLIGNVGTTSTVGKQVHNVRIVDYSTEEESPKESNVSLKQLALDTIEQAEMSEQTAKNVGEKDNNGNTICNNFQLHDEDDIFVDVHSNFGAKDIDMDLEKMNISQSDDHDVYKLQDLVNTSQLDGDTTDNIEDIYNEPGMDNFLGSLLNTSAFLQATEEIDSAGVFTTPVIKATQVDDDLLEKEHEAAATLATAKQQADKSKRNQTEISEEPNVTNLAIVPIVSNKELPVVSETEEESDKQKKEDKEKKFAGKKEDESGALRDKDSKKKSAALVIDGFHTPNAPITRTISPVSTKQKTLNQKLKELSESYTPKCSKHNPDIMMIVDAQPLQIEFPAGCFKEDAKVVRNQRKGKQAGTRKRGCVEPNKEDETEVLIDNEKRFAKVSEFLRSPFAEREICLTSKRTTDEERVARFIFSASHPPSSVFFQTHAYVVEVYVFETLYPGFTIASSIIDVWAQILNYEENRRNVFKNFRRVFCSTQALTYDAISLNRDQTVTDETFNDNCTLSVLQTPHGNYKKVNLVFFPILKISETKRSTNNHYYLVCFNLKDFRIDIIDNIKMTDEEVDNQKTVFERYGNLPNLLRSKFCKYLAVKEKLQCAFDLMTKEIQILNIGWATEKNSVDCGIFVMRHMECYKGNGLADFDTQLNTEDNGQQSQLDDLRRKYLAKILLSDFNDIANHTREKVKEYDRLDNNLRLKHKKAAKAKIKKRIASTLGA